MRSEWVVSFKLCQINIISNLYRKSSVGYWQNGGKLAANSELSNPFSWYYNDLFHPTPVRLMHNAFFMN